MALSTNIKKNEDMYEGWMDCTTNIQIATMWSCIKKKWMTEQIYEHLKCGIVSKISWTKYKYTQFNMFMTICQAYSLVTIITELEYSYLNCKVIAM